MGKKRNKGNDKPLILRLKAVVFALLLSEFVRSLGFNLYTISLPLVVEEFASSAILIGFTVSIFGFVQSAAQLPLGNFSDKHGRRGILLFSAFLYAFGALMVSLAQTLLIFIIFRAVQGMGAIISVLQATLGDIFPAEKRGTAMAGFSIVYAVGSAVGVPIGGLIGGLFGLRVPFYIGAGLAFVSAIILVVLLKETHPMKVNKTKKLVTTKTPENRPPTSSIDSRFKENISLKPSSDQPLIYSERAGNLSNTKTTSTSSPDSLNASMACPSNSSPFRNRGFLVMGIIGISVNSAMGSFFAFAPLFLVTLGYSVFQMGLIFIPGIAVFFGGSFAAGIWSDRRGRREPILIGLSIAVSFSVFALFAPGRVIIPVLITSLFGISLVMPPLTALVLDCVPETLRGKATGIYNTMTILGNSIGALAAGFVVSALGPVSMFLVSAIVIAISLALGFWKLPRGLPPKNNLN